MWENPPKMNEPQRGIRLFSFRGTTVDVEISFLILIGLFVILDLDRGEPLRVALLWVPILFLSILLHELGHAAAIGVLGFGQSEIRLAGLGGATMNRRSAGPWQEIVISVAGPLVSFGISLVSWLILRSTSDSALGPLVAALLPQLAYANLAWGVFNLLPIYPLDGGHVVQQIARKLLAPMTAAKTSAISSLIFAAILIALAIPTRQFFLIILGALFVLQNYQRLTLLKQVSKEDPTSPRTGESGPERHDEDANQQ